MMKILTDDEAQFVVDVFDAVDALTGAWRHVEKELREKGHDDPENTYTAIGDKLRG